MQILSFLNERNQIPVGTRILHANTALSRLVGLLCHDQLAHGEGLWITPCRAIHTFGMRFPIDVVALDSNMRVTRLWTHVKANRATGLHRGVRSVLELPAGEICRLDLRVGDQIKVHDCPQ